MRRLFGLLLLFSSLALIDAAPAAPKATATPATTASPAATASAAATATPAVPAGAPAVMIYPFDTPSDLDPKYGGAVAQIYAQVLTQSGGLNVLTIPQNIKREDYAKYAHSKHADYYISGYIQPIGSAAAIVAQIFDVNNDISVYSQTTQIANVQDVGSQALNAHAIIMQSAGVDRPTIATQTETTPTPSSTSGATVSLTNVLGGLFKGHSSGASAGTTPTPLPKPARGVIVAHLIGNAQRDDLNIATDELFRAMNAHYTTAMTTLTSGNVAKQADAICGSHRDNTVASGTLDVARTSGLRAHNVYTFTLGVYTCFGATLYSNTQTGPDRAKVLQNAVDAYVSAHPDNS